MESAKERKEERPKDVQHRKKRRRTGLKVTASVLHNKERGR